MTAELKNELEKIVLESFHECQKMGYSTQIFESMIDNRGVVEAIRNLIDREEPSKGFLKFLRSNNLKFSAEAIINENPKFNELFAGTAVVEKADERLKEYGYKLEVKT